VQKLPKLSITQPEIVRFYSNLLQTMSTWHTIYHRGQRSTSQRDITYHRQKNRYISRTDRFVKIIPPHSLTR